MVTQSIYKTPQGEKAVLARYDALLARWPAPCEALTVPTRHGDTFVMSSGKDSAPPLVLLHGAGTNAAMWLGDAALYGQDYRVYAVDLLGEPGRSTPNRPAWDSPAYAEWLADVLDALKIKSATLIGISQGGWTALKFAVNHSERVTALVLMSPGGITPVKMSFLVWAILLSMLGRPGIRRLNRMIMGDQPITREVDDTLTLITTNFKPRVGVLPLFSDAELQRLTMSVQLLMGDRDVLRDAARIQARLQPLLPHLTATVIPGGGHALINTTTHILPFLAGIDL